MYRGRCVVICTALLILVLPWTFIISGCLKTGPNTSGGTTKQTPSQVNTLPPSSGDASGGTLQAGAGDRSGSQMVQPVITYGAYALWTGKWDTIFFRYGGAEHSTVWNLKQVESNITGSYDWDSGRISIRQSKTSGLAIGTWSESPTYMPPNDAGDIEIQQSQDGNSFVGKWRYGSSGDWIGEWNGARIR
jgi:hypothetical protein